MKELNNFRKFLSENAMPDFTIMGETFNFSDICPSAHKLVQNQSIVHHGFSNTAPIVLNFAIKHREFFNLERKALGSQGITVDEYNDDVTRLYTEILNIAEKLGVRKAAKEYMDMHMAKIKDNGFKASEPGGSSDRNFEEGHEPTDKELDYADEIEYEQDWRDEQDALFGKIREVRSRLESEVEGYTDLHKNDVVLEAFLGESNAERNPLRGIKNMFQAIIPLKLDTSPIGSLGYAKAIGIEGDWNAIQFFTEYPDKYEKYKDLLSQANRFGVDINPSTNVLDAYNAVAAAANEYDLKEGPLDEKQKYADDQLKFKKGDTVYFKNVKGGEKLPMTITGPGKFRDSNRLGAGGKEIVFPVKGGPGGKGMYAADDLVKEDLKENLEEGAYETFDAIFMKLPFALKVITGLGFWGLVLAFFTSVENLNSVISYFRKKKAEKEGKTTYIDYESGEEVEINENIFKKGISSLKNLVKAAPNMMKMAKELKDTLTRAMELPGMQQAAENFDFKKMLDIFNSEADPEDKKRVEAFKVKNGIRMGSNALEEGPIQTFTQGLDTYTKYPHVFVFKVRTMSMDKQGGKFVHDSRYEIEEDMTFNEAVKQAEYFISLPETIGVKVDLHYTTGNTEGQLGGQVEVLRWTHDAWYKGAKSEYIQNAEKNKNEDIEAERIIAIRRWLNSSSMGRQPENVDDQEETWSTSTKNMKEKVKNILATQ